MWKYITLYKNTNILIITRVVAVFFHKSITILIFKPTQSTQNMLNNRKHILEQSTWLTLIGRTGGCLARPPQLVYWVGPPLLPYFCSYWRLTEPRMIWLPYCNSISKLKLIVMNVFSLLREKLENCKFCG